MESRCFVETHLLDHQQEIYGQVIKLDFVERLRDEKRFPDVQSLLGQIHKDIDTTHALLARLIHFFDRISKGAL